MSKSTPVKPKNRGRPKTGVDNRDPIVGIRMPPEMRRAVEGWASNQDDKPSLSEALRRLVERGLMAARTDAQVELRASALKRALSSEPAKASTRAQPRRSAKNDRT
jgi:hypothetical protein